MGTVLTITGWVSAAVIALQAVGVATAVRSALHQQVLWLIILAIIGCIIIAGMGHVITAIEDEAVVARLGAPDCVQRSPSGGLHLYYPATGIPEALTDNATWEIEATKVGGDIRGSNGWVGVYDLPAVD